jgi:hypothetical protein
MRLDQVFNALCAELWAWWVSLQFRKFPVRLLKLRLQARYFFVVLRGVLLARFYDVQIFFIARRQRRFQARILNSQFAIRGCNHIAASSTKENNAATIGSLPENTV